MSPTAGAPCLGVPSAEVRLHVGRLLEEAQRLRLTGVGGGGDGGRGGDREGAGERGGEPWVRSGVIMLQTLDFARGRGHQDQHRS